MEEKDECENCDCTKCCKPTVNPLSPNEIIGWTAIVIGTFGAIIQLGKSGSSKDLRSFSIIYLLTATFAELLFMIQGIMIKDVSITVTRLFTFLYFGSFLVLWFLYEWNRK